MIYRISLFFSIPCCLAFFAPPKLHPPSLFVVEDPTFLIHQVSTVESPFDALDAISLHPVPRRTRARTSSLRAAAEESNHYLSTVKNRVVSDTSYELEPILAANSVGIGGYNPAEKLGLERETAIVGDPQVAQLDTMNITMVLTELQAIQSQGPKKYCILGTRHCSFLHQQIVEMLYVFYLLITSCHDPNLFYLFCIFHQIFLPSAEHMLWFYLAITSSPQEPRGQTPQPFAEPCAHSSLSFSLLFSRRACPNKLPSHRNYCKTSPTLSQCHRMMQCHWM